MERFNCTCQFLVYQISSLRLTATLFRQGFVFPRSWGQERGWVN